MDTCQSSLTDSEEMPGLRTTVPRNNFRMELKISIFDIHDFPNQYLQLPSENLISCMLLL